MIAFFQSIAGRNRVERRYFNYDGMILDNITFRKRDWSIFHNGKLIEFKGTPPKQNERLLICNLVNLETGEVLRCNNTDIIPSWVFDPLARAIKVEEFKRSRK